MDYSDILQDISVDLSFMIKKHLKNIKKLDSKKQKEFTKLFVDMKQGVDDLSEGVNESVNEANYNTKQDAMNAYMNGKVSAKELDKIAKNDFNSSVATKKELQNFLDSGYMKTLMANTYGLKVPAMEKKVKELMMFAEGTLKEDIQYFESVNEAKYHISKDKVGARIAGAIYNNANAIVDRVIDDKADAKEVVSIMGPVLINAIKATIKHKFKPMPGKEADLKKFQSKLKELLKLTEKLVKKPSKAGVKRLEVMHREWWNFNFGAAIVLNGELMDSIVELNEAVELVHVYKDGKLYGTGELVKGKDKKIKGKKHQLIRFDGSTEDYYPAKDVKLVESINEAEEPEIITQLRKGGYQTIKDPQTGKKHKVDNYSASAIVAVYDALKKDKVKEKFVNLPLPKMVSVAFKAMK
jgi:hypothetical protein